jgi:hypothetical protein
VSPEPRVRDGGASLISLQLRELELNVRGEERADFGISLEDGRSGAFVERPPFLGFEREGATLKARVDFGAFQFFRSEAGNLKVLLLVPKDYRGSLSLSFAEGSVELRDLCLAGLNASMTLGHLMSSKVTGVWNVYAGEVGAGGPRVRVKTDAGSVAILRSAR